MRVLLIEGLSHDEVQHWNRDDFNAAIDQALTMEGDERGDYDAIMLVDDAGDVMVGCGPAINENPVGAVMGTSVIV